MKLKIGREFEQTAVVFRVWLINETAYCSTRALLSHTMGLKWSCTETQRFKGDGSALILLTKQENMRLVDLEFGTEIWWFRWEEGEGV